LTLLALDSASAPPAQEHALLVEGANTELLRLDGSLAVAARRTLPARYDAAISVYGRVLALSREDVASPGASSPGAPPGASARAGHSFTWLGSQPSEDVQVALPSALPADGAVRRARSGGHALFVWTDGRHPPRALSLRLDPTASAPGEAVRLAPARPLSPPVDLADARAVQLLGLAISPDGYAAIVRVGAAEAADSQVWLATERAYVPVDTLEDAADIESIAIVGDQVWAIATFEFSRPLLFRIAASGELTEDPVALPRDASLPAPLAAGDPARLLEEGSRLLLRRRNPMGDPLYPDYTLADRTGEQLPADVVREGARYLVVYQDRDEVSGSWPLRFASIDCASE
jgi:hypothetical protein